MPAPEVTVTSNYPHPIVKHVNLMVDTYLANATVEERSWLVRGQCTGDGSTAEILTEVDADIVQAIQSCKEELVSDHLKERGAARQIVSKLQYAIQNCSSEEVLAFEKAAHSIQHWKF
ncbi:hypothetical protein LENED_000580 [Lentinula edodes]|uniref:Uncharacterized protein n=1 Tax=Lentinula edodes TaxID=5353 RepID=A0A1Q3DW48_LENED|nr:hypothetical protein LENED_000580 [Lentinula edodes]